MKEEPKHGVEPFVLKGDGGTPIAYEAITPWRDVVYLVWNRPYGEEEQSGGAPAFGTFNYTGYIREKKGQDFALTYFSNIVADGHVSNIKGTGILFDGGANWNWMTYDPATMKFWKTGEQSANWQATPVEETLA